MTTRFATIAVTALVCLPLGILLGVLIHSHQSYVYKTLESPVGSERGFGHLTGFFKKESEWRGGVSRTDARNEPEWFAFYNRDGAREGPVIHYWPGGNVSKVTHYHDGKLHGQYVAFSRNGNLESMAYYDNGDLVENSSFRKIEPTKAVNDFFASIEDANHQLDGKFRGELISNLPEDAILKETE